MFDYLGKEITVGSYIIYVRLYSKTPYLKPAKVVELRKNNIKCLTIGNTYKYVSLINTDKVLVINKEQLDEKTLTLLE